MIIFACGCSEEVEYKMHCPEFKFYETCDSAYASRHSQDFVCKMKDGDLIHRFSPGTVCRIKITVKRNK